MKKTEAAWEASVSEKYRFIDVKSQILVHRIYFSILQTTVPESRCHGDQRYNHKASCLSIRLPVCDVVVSWLGLWRCGIVAWNSWEIFHGWLVITRSLCRPQHHRSTSTPNWTPQILAPVGVWYGILVLGDGCTKPAISPKRSKIERKFKVVHS